MIDFSRLKIGDKLVFHSDEQWPSDCFINGHTYEVLDISDKDDKMLTQRFAVISTESPSFYSQHLAKSLMLAMLVGNKFGIDNFCLPGRMVICEGVAENFTYSRKNLSVVR